MHLLSLVSTGLCLVGAINAAAISSSNPDPPPASSLASKVKRQQGTSISLIGSARISAFRAASSAFVAATPQPNQIVCPGVIGAAPTPTEEPVDKVRLRADPSVVSFLEGRQSIRPTQSHDSHRRHHQSPQTASSVSNDPYSFQRRDLATSNASPEPSLAKTEESTTPHQRRNLVERSRRKKLKHLNEDGLPGTHMQWITECINYKWDDCPEWTRTEMPETPETPENVPPHSRTS